MNIKRIAYAVATIAVGGAATLATIAAPASATPGSPYCFSVSDEAFPEPVGLCIAINEAIDQPAPDDATTAGTLQVKVTCNTSFPVGTCDPSVFDRTFTVNRTGADPGSIVVSTTTLTRGIPLACVEGTCAGGGSINAPLLAVSDVVAVWVNGTKVVGI